MAASGRIDELRKRYDENQRRFFAPLANEYRKAGDLEQAISICQLHLVDAPSNLSGQIVFGQALFDAGSLDESRAAFETAIGLDPENLIALRHLGDIARAQNDVPRAKEWYQRVLDADRRNDDVLALMQELNALEAAAVAAVHEEPAAPPPPDWAAEIQQIADPPHIEAAPVVDVGAPADSFVESAADAAFAPTPSMVEASREVEVARIPMPVAQVHPEAITLQIEAIPVPSAASAFERPADESPAEAAATHTAPTLPDELDFGDMSGEPVPTTADQAAAPASFELDVNLDAADGLPVAADDGASAFGHFELPNDAPFGESVAAPEASQFAAEPAPAFENAFAVEETAPEPAIVHEATPEPVAESSSEPASDIPSVLEYVEAAAEPAAPDSGLLDFVPDEAAPAPPEATTTLGGFELLDSAPAPEAAAVEPVAEASVEPWTPPAAAEAAEPWTAPPLPDLEVAAEASTVAETPAEPVTAVEEAATFDTFDPIREMPTPVAPIEAAAELTPTAPSAAVVSEPDAPAPSAEVFATETMAELYVRQGLRQEAIVVYRQLIDARPGDDSLKRRLSELSGEPSRTGGSTARAFFANLAGRRATPVRAYAVEVPAPPAAAVVEPPGPVMPAPDVVAELPMDEAPATEASPADARVGELPAAEVPVVPTEAPAEPTIETAPPAPEPAVPAPLTTGTLDALFGHSGIETHDENAAQSLAAAFGNAPATISGRPTRAASDEVSLDRIFREPTSTPSKGGLAVPRQSSSLRFDQFFNSTPDAPAAAPTPPPADPGGESEQFQAWLSGLKKP